jgi:hypothetical protein
VLKVAKPEDNESVLVVWRGQVNVNNGVAAGGVIKEEVKAIGQQFSA